MNNFKKDIISLTIFLIFLLTLFFFIAELRAETIFSFSPRSRESPALPLKQEEISSIRSLYLAAKKDFRHGDYNAAIVKFKKVIELEKGLSPAYTPLAKEYIELAKERKKILTQSESTERLKGKQKGLARKKEEERLSKVAKIKSAYNEAKKDYLEAKVKFEDVVKLEEKLGLISITPAEEFRNYLAQKEEELEKQEISKVPAEVNQEPQVFEYTIGDGDVLYISVWQEETLSQEVIVRPDGRISFPLGGNIQAEGLTFSQLSEELTKRLKEYVRVPVVSVSLRKLGGKKVIVLGEVKNPGVYSVTGRRTVLEAIALANGFTKDAVLSSVIVIKGGLKNPKGIRLNLSRAMKKADMSQNIILQPEDIVYIPRSFIANISYLLDQILTPISRGVYIANNVQEW